jgi:hypothetical protein
MNMLERDCVKLLWAVTDITDEVYSGRRLTINDQQTLRMAITRLENVLASLQSSRNMEAA